MMIKDNKKKALLIIIFFLVSVLFPYLLPAFNSLEVKILIELLLVFVFIYLFNSDIKKSFKKFKSKYLLYVGLFYVGATILNIVTNNVLINVFNINISNNLALDTILSQSKLYFIILTFVTEPVLECFVLPISFYELLKNNEKLYYLVSSLFYGLFLIVFSFSSLSQLILIISYSFYGFSLAYLYCKTKNMFVPYIFKIIQALMILFAYLY